MLAPLLLLAALSIGGLAAGPVPATAQDAGTQLTEPERDPVEVRATVREVLDRPEFQEPGRPFLQRIQDWIVDRIESVVDGLLSGGRAGVLAWILLPGAALVGSWFLFRFARGVSPDATRRAARGAGRRRPPEDWRAEAEAHARAGRWRDAVRCRYRALVAELGRRGLLEEVAGRTVGEYREEVATNAPGVAPDFSVASELFEVAWYGRGPTGELQDERLRALADRVLS